MQIPCPTCHGRGWRFLDADFSDERIDYPTCDGCGTVCEKCKMPSTNYCFCTEAEEDANL